MDTIVFYEKLKNKQTNTQKWNAIIEDIIILFNSHFTDAEKLFTADEFWDFMFTSRKDHLSFHTKIWSTFSITKYNNFFKTLYDAMDDPSTDWWRNQ